MEKKVYLWLKENFLLLILLIFFSCLFFFRLDYKTLESFDEAWYGSIAREIVKTGDWIHLKWNGLPFYDHPPVGFWLMAISYKLFGITELSTRFPSAILGLFTIILLYLIAFNLFGKRSIGFAAASILGTSVWYLIRVRSGNLDSIFAFFYILTIYISLKSSKDFRWFPIVMIVFGGLILSKTLVGISALILIVFLNIRQLMKIRNIPYMLLGLGAFYLVVAPWYKAQMKEWSDFVQYHFFNIGLRMRNNKDISHFKINWQLPLFYLHMGIRKWYYIWLMAMGLLIITFQWFKKNIFFIFLWTMVILSPFLISTKTEIWHLIPTYVPLALVSAVGVYQGIFFGQKIIKSLISYRKILNIVYRPTLFSILYIFVFLLISTIQIKNFIPEVFATSRYIPDDVDISKRATKYKQTLYLDDDFLPRAVFYSKKNVIMLSKIPEGKKNLVEFYQTNTQNMIVVTRNWALNNLNQAGIKYKLLESNNSFSIITRP